MRHNCITSRIAMIKKKKRAITSVGKDMQKSEPKYTVGGNVTWCSCCQFLKLLNIELPPYDPGIRLIGIYLRKSIGQIN